MWDGINTTEHLQSDTDKAYIHNHDSSSSSPSNNDRETAVSVQTLVSKEEKKKMYGKVKAIKILNDVTTLPIIVGCVTSFRDRFTMQ